MIAYNFGLSECNRVKELTPIEIGCKHENGRVNFLERVLIHVRDQDFKD